MLVILEIAGVSAVGLTVYGMWLFDRLVRWEYEHHRERWERDGRPDGYFWRAEGYNFWKSDTARKRVSVTWLLATPLWAANAPECRRWLRQSRAVALIWIVLVLLLGSRVVAPNFVGVGPAKWSPIVNNVRNIEEARKQWLVEFGKTNSTNVVAKEEISLELKRSPALFPDGWVKSTGVERYYLNPATGLWEAQLEQNLDKFPKGTRFRLDSNDSVQIISPDK